MKEELLHYVWRMQRFDCHHLCTTDGQKINIIRFGELNQHAGPDFTDARIQIEDTFWAGNVEMHLKASDWLAHGHQHDPSYNNVILHVVMEEDCPIHYASGERIPCLELKTRIPNRVAKIYQRLQHNEHWIPCQQLLYKVPNITRQVWLDRLLVERLERRTTQIKEQLEAKQNDWEACLYHCLARSFGMKVNADPFEQLVAAIPFSIVMKHKHNLYQLEALFFGQAGLLEDVFEEDYPLQLQREYRFLAHKYGLRPISATHWKFLRMRPANFPTVRIAQFALLLHQTEHLFSKVLSIQQVKEVEHMFELHLSNYWQTHYLLNRPSVKKKKALGKTTIHLLVMNTLAPLLFLYGREKGYQVFCDKAMQLLAEIPPESNHIIAAWENLGVKPESAHESQALLELKHEYCDQRRCLECGIGHAMFNAG